RQPQARPGTAACHTARDLPGPPIGASSKAGRRRRPDPLPPEQQIGDTQAQALLHVQPHNLPPRFQERDAELPRLLHPQQRHHPIPARGRVPALLRRNALVAPLPLPAPHPRDAPAAHRRRADGSAAPLPQPPLAPLLRGAGGALPARPARALPRRAHRRDAQHPPADVQPRKAESGDAQARGRGPGAGPEFRGGPGPAQRGRSAAARAAGEQRFPARGGAGDEHAAGGQAGVRAGADLVAAAAEHEACGGERAGAGAVGRRQRLRV
ncbi:hypothetical protein LTR53_016605, partial [Teratosphaeriaceae sp. CCFEE 6253]